MPSPEQIEYASLLARKAENDARACGALVASSEMADDVVGFHAQQAVEKALKAVLVIHGIDFPHTHDLEYLVELATERGIEVQDSIIETEWLTPWAADLRYDEPSSALDRSRALDVATAAAAWAAAQVAGADQPKPTPEPAPQPKEPPPGVFIPETGGGGPPKTSR